MLTEVKVRIQKKLQVPDEEFSKVLRVYLFWAVNILLGHAKLYMV